MNAKLLYAATIALALASGLAMADEGQPLSREQVAAAWKQGAADGTLRRNDYDYDKIDASALSVRTRQEVVAEMAASRPNPALLGPLRNRTFNPAGMETLRVSTLPRAEVKAQVLAAMHEGTLRRSDYDDAPVRARRVTDRVAAPVLAGTTGRASTGG